MRKVLAIAAATALFIIALAAVIPMIPFKARELGGDGTTVGLLFSAFGAAALVAVPLWGRLSDRVGRRRVLAASAAISAVAYLLLGLADTLTTMYLARILGGLGFGWFATAQALASDVAPAGKRAGALGLVGAAFGVGFTLGPAIQTLADSQGWSLDVVAYAASGLCVAALLAAGLLPRGRRPEPQPDLRALRLLPPPSFKLLAIHALVFVGFTAMEATLALFAADELSLEPGDVGTLLVVAGIANTAMQGGAVGRLVPRFGELGAARIGHGCLALGAFGLIAAGALGQVWLAYAAMAVLAAGLGLHAPSFQAALARVGGDSARGVALGAAQSASTAARIVGPAAGGALYDGASHAAALLLTAAAALAALAFSTRVTLPRERPAPEPA